MTWTSFIIPSIISAVLLYGLIKGVNVFDEFVAGAGEGLQTAIKIVPALVALMTCVGMFKASGGVDIITHAVEPFTRLLGIPSEVVPLALLRPVSGSGALAIYNDILATHGADSTVSRIASVLMGSSETTFYTIAIYFGAYKVVKTKHTAICAIFADFVCFIMSAAVVSLFF